MKPENNNKRIREQYKQYLEEALKHIPKEDIVLIQKVKNELEKVTEELEKDAGPEKEIDEIKKTLEDQGYEVRVMSTQELEMLDMIWHIREQLNEKNKDLKVELDPNQKSFTEEDTKPLEELRQARNQTKDNQDKDIEPER